MAGSNAASEPAAAGGFLRLREFTSARVMLGRTGHSVPTPELLNFQLAHARARDAVHTGLDVASLMIDLKQRNLECLAARSAAPDRLTYLRRPDLGRRFSPDSIGILGAAKAEFDDAFVIADGLSALAEH